LFGNGCFVFVKNIQGRVGRSGGEIGGGSNRGERNIILSKTKKKKKRCCGPSGG